MAKVKKVFKKVTHDFCEILSKIFRKLRKYRSFKKDLIIEITDSLRKVLSLSEKFLIKNV